MASLSDIYGSQASTPHERLLSARAGALNTTVNMIPRSGFAAPAVSMLAGSQAAASEQDQLQQAQAHGANQKKQQFLETFTKLSKVSKGAAVGFFNKMGPGVGIDIPIDGLEVQPDLTSVHFENGMIVGYGPGGVYKPSGDGGSWEPVDQNFLDQFKQANDDSQQLKADSKTKPAKETSALDLLKEYNKNQQKKNAMKAATGSKMSAEDIAALDRSDAELDSQYYSLTGQHLTAQPGAQPSPSGGMSLGDIRFGANSWGAPSTTNPATIAPPATPAAATTPEWMKYAK